jgi:Na+-driven multidrug efflux pump
VRENIDAVAAINRRLCLWGIVFGIVVGIVLFAGSGIIPRAFASEPAVIDALSTLLPVLALSMPIAGYVFVLDGVLMGAEDARYLALAQLVAVVGYAILLIPIVSPLAGSTGALGRFLHRIRRIPSADPGLASPQPGVDRSRRRERNLMNAEPNRRCT